MHRVSTKSRTLKKKKSNSPTDGHMFRQQSLLNKRGSECFPTGTCLIRLQDFSDDFNIFNNTVWTVVNHNLIRKYEYVSKDSIYAYFKPTDRYTRWLPQFANDYISVEDIIEVDDGEEYKIGVILPTHEKIIERFEESTQDRRALDLPPVNSDNSSDNEEEEESQSIVSGNSQPTAAPTAATTSFSTPPTPSFTFESTPQSSADYHVYENVATDNNNNNMYDAANTYYYVDDFSDLQNMNDNIYYVNDDDSVDILPDIYAPSENVMEESHLIIFENAQAEATQAASPDQSADPFFIFESTPQSSVDYLYDDAASNNNDMYDAANTYYYLDDFSDLQNMDDNIYYVNVDDSNDSTGYNLFI